MPKVKAAPFALACWLGILGRRWHAHGDDLIFFYHGTPRKDASPLELQLRYLRREFRIVPLTELVDEQAPGKSRTGRRRASITFDDGLRSNVQVAYPILSRLGICATMFVCPALIEQRRWLWTQEARRRLAFLSAGDKNEIAAEFGVAADPESIVRWMKTLDMARRNAAEARIREASPGYAPTRKDREAFDLATWQELRSLDASVVTVESHTLTHPILTHLTPAELDQELCESRRQIETHLQRPVRILAYPNGDVDAKVLACAQKYYRAAVTCVPGGFQTDRAFRKSSRKRFSFHSSRDARVAAASDSRSHRRSSTSITARLNWEAGRATRASACYCRSKSRERNKDEG